MTRLARAPGVQLAAVLSALVLVTVLWVRIDRRPPEWDYANHLERAARCGQILSDRGLAGWPEIIGMSSFYPPVVACATGLVSLLVPLSPLTAQSVILAFGVLALVSLFVLGRRLFDAPTGVLAALVFGAAPFVVVSTTNFQLDLPLAAAVIFSLLMLDLTEDWSRRGWSLLLGLTLAFGMLVKLPFALYLVPPLVFVAWRALRAAGSRPSRLANLVLALLLGGGLSLPWYGPRLLGLPLQIANRSFKQAAQQGSPETLTAASLLFYPRWLPATFGLLATPLLVWGLLALARAREGRARGLVASAALVPFAVLLLIQNQNLRYVLPLFPVAALIAAAALRGLAPACRRPLTLALIGLSALQVSAAAFGVPAPLARWTAFGVPLVFSAPPLPVAWPHRRILEAIVGHAQGGRPAMVSVVPNYSAFSVSNFRYYAVRDRLPLRWTRAWDEHPLGVEFVILKTGDQGPAFSIAKPRRIMERLAAGDPAFERAFPVIWQDALPDGSVASVRQRRLGPVAGVTPEELVRRVRDGLPRFLEPYAREVEGFSVDLVYAPDALVRGQIRRVRLSATAARVAEFERRSPQLRVRELRLTLDGVLLNPYRLVASGQIEPLDIERLRIEHLVVTQEDLRAFLTSFRGPGRLGLGLEDGAVSVSFSWPGLEVTGRLELVNGSGSSPLAVRADRASLAGIPLPPLLVPWVVRQFDPTPRLAKLPVTVELGRIRVEPGRLVIGAPTE